MWNLFSCLGHCLCSTYLLHHFQGSSLCNYSWHETTSFSETPLPYPSKQQKMLDIKADYLADSYVAFKHFYYELFVQQKPAGLAGSCHLPGKSMEG
jgi:hypothetical protein